MCFLLRFRSLCLIEYILILGWWGYRSQHDQCRRENASWCLNNFGEYQKLNWFRKSWWRYYLQQNSDGVITFKLVPTDGKLGQRESKVRVKAYFDYNPDNDPYIPCKEAGLAFTRGDILHIVSQVKTSLQSLFIFSILYFSELSGRRLLVASEKRSW